MDKPKVSANAQKELDKVEKQFNEFENDVKNITKDCSVRGPIQDVEPQTKLSQKEIEKSNRLELKPDKWVSDNQKFNEKFRADWEFKKELVNFIAENIECKGDVIEMWTHPFGGVGAAFWKIPVNKPVWAPRYVADQLKANGYNRMVMTQTTTSVSGEGSYYGALAVDSFVKRVDANPVNNRKSVFMGASGF
jgi:hypothetical protein